MPAPKSRHARRFYLCAFARYDEARHLEGGGFGTAAVYLGGYAVECVLKALLLEATPPGKRAEVLESFRGVRAHDFRWLRYRYHRAGGAPAPTEVVRAFTDVDDWSTELRYSPAITPPGEVRDFLRATAVILRWADGRL